MRINVEKMFCLPDAGSLRAFADICLDGQIVIRGLRILDGKKGLFITMPREQSKDNKWYDQVVCKDAATFEQIASVVLEHYRREQGILSSPSNTWNTNVGGVRL